MNNTTVKVFNRNAFRDQLQEGADKLNDDSEAGMMEN